MVAMINRGGLCKDNSRDGLRFIRKMTEYILDAVLEFERCLALIQKATTS